MALYFLKRFLFFIPSLLIIILIGFIISKLTPGDPVHLMIKGQQSNRTELNTVLDRKLYLNKRIELGLHLPLFYLSVHPLSVPKHLHSYIPKDQNLIERLCYKTGNKELVLDYLSKLHALENKIIQNKDSIHHLPNFTVVLNSIKDEYNLSNINSKIDDFILSDTSETYAHDIKEIKLITEKLERHKSKWKTWIPVLSFYGFDNQFHRWLIRIVTLDFGNSYIDQQPIIFQLKKALPWTLAINIISLIIAYLIAIPIGTFSAYYENYLSKRLHGFLLMLYSLPNFWIATILLIFLCGGDYLDIFPASGIHSITYSDDWSILQKTIDVTKHLALPIFCITYLNIAYVGLQVHSFVNEVKHANFITTAKAKGLSTNKVIWNHLFRNAILPLITLTGQYLPTLIAGSIIVESIFGIPGMGSLTYNAVLMRDMPTLIAVFTLSGFLTILGIFIADVFYTFADPRIQFHTK